MKVFQVRKDTQIDKTAQEMFGPRKNHEVVKMLEGWSMINISATYALSNCLEGQLINIDKLPLYNSTKNPKFRIHKMYE